MRRRDRQRRIAIFRQRQGQERGQQRHRFTEWQVKDLEHRLELGKARRNSVLRLPAGQQLEMLDHRVERAAGVIGRAADGDPGQALGADLGSEPVDQHALADPRLAADRHDLAARLFLGALPGAAQKPGLLVAPDERRRRRFARGSVRVRIPIALETGHAPCRNRSGNSFQRLRAEILVVEGVAGELLGERAENDTIASRDAL